MRTFLRHAPVVLAVVVAAAIVTHVSAQRSAAAASAEMDDAHAAMDEYVQERMEATRTPGLAYAVVDSSGIIHQRAWGRDGDGRPVDDATPFLWGSVSKPVAATAVMTLVEAGELGLDAPVKDYLPWFSMADETASARITVRQLLDHTSGIPEGTGITDRFDIVQDPYRDAIEGLADVHLLFEPGERHEYTSANYLVLGAVVEAVSERTFADYLCGAVLDPLGMSGTITTPAEAGAALPRGHRYIAGRPLAMTTPYDQAGPSYGYLGGTVNDLAHFAAAQLGGGRLTGYEVLSTDSVESMQSGAARVNEQQSYGLGWRDMRIDGLRMVWHGGATPGYQAMVALLPQHDRAVVVLQNVYGYFQDAELAATGLNTARLVAGAEPRNVSGNVGYPMLLGALGLVAAAGLVALGWSLRLLIRPLPRPVGRRRSMATAALWMLTGAGIAVLTGVMVPRSFGVALRDVPLYAPDLGWLLAVIAGVGVLLVPVHLVVAIRRARTVAGH